MSSIPRGLSGLKNLGNTCYMNSILQCISSLSILRTYITDETTYNKLCENIKVKIAEKEIKDNNLSENAVISLPKKIIEDETDRTITLALFKLLKNMWRENRQYEPKTFKSVIGKHSSTFSGYDQNDSQELLNLILDKVHEELKVEVKVLFDKVPEKVQHYMQIKNGIENLPDEEKLRYTEYLKECKNEEIISAAYIYWKNFIVKSHSIITDLFTGLYYSKVTCSECNDVMFAFEPFTILSLPTNFNKDATLEELLESFCSKETLSGENQYTCNVCKKKTDATKEMRIWNPPNILIIQLKRFQNTNDRITKTISTIKYPITGLNMKPYLSDLYDVQKTNYNLIAISEHRGTCDFGHYVAYCKNEINNKWYEFDDEDIYYIPENELENELITPNAYILFYCKTYN
jgi:ubiquitin carboxyl-terminal hydrolase 8